MRIIEGHLEILKIKKKGRPEFSGYISNGNRLLTVEGMSCEHCINRIRNSVGILNGVENVTVDLENKKVIVEYDPQKVNANIIKETIEDQGYRVR